MTKEELDEIHEYTAAATEGPWSCWDASGKDKDMAVSRIGPGSGGLRNLDRYPIHGSEADFTFVARSREDMVRLLDDIEQRERLIQSVMHETSAGSTGNAEERLDRISKSVANYLAPW